MRLKPLVSQVHPETCAGWTICVITFGAVTPHAATSTTGQKRGLGREMWKDDSDATLGMSAANKPHSKGSKCLEDKKEGFCKFI